jgi:hypothetical protein
MEVKKRVRDLLDRLPEDCTFDDVLYHLHVIHEVERGRADMDAGRVMSHDAVVEQLRRRWLTGTTG